MKHFDLPEYGIWKTDDQGKRIIGFTPQQVLDRDRLWQEDRKRLETALVNARKALIACASTNYDTAVLRINAIKEIEGLQISK
jgi:hypothetical protein